MTDTTKPQDIRQGRKRPWVRRILYISTAAAVIALFAILFAQ